jgi:hypothetical protein
MAFKLPKDIAALPKDILDKVNKLPGAVKKEWESKFDECSINKVLYEDLIKKIQAGKVGPDELNETISNKKALEELITSQENELLRMLNEPVDKTDLEKVLEKILPIQRQGTNNIRPPKGVYKAPTGRK